MAATYVTAAELKANLGIGTLYSDSIVEEVCQTAEDMLNSYLWFDSYPVVGATLQDNVATVVISFFATLGACAVVFNHIFHFKGADPSFPLFAFIFLVALGIDYNIFLMTRVREEAQKMGTRAGMTKALTVTGGVITSAGIVLAATFAVLGILPLVFLAELGFAVGFGVLLDTMLVRSILVPALVHEIGPKVWWPSKLQHHGK
jgi:RND superfamily putative drug exporter